MSKGWLALVVCPALIGCAVGKDSTLIGACASESEGVTAQRHSAFSQTLHSVFQRRDCRSCHTTGGVAPYPFGAADVATAYPFARQLSNLDLPANSRFVTKVGNELHECGSNCAAIAAEMTAAIGEWAALEAPLPPFICDDSLGSEYAIRTSNRTVIIGDLTMTPAWLRYNLAQATPAMPGAAFEVGVMLVTPPSEITNGAFAVSAPKLALPPGIQLRISRLVVRLNGKPVDHATNFSGVNTVVSGQSYSFDAPMWPFPVLFDGVQMLLVQKPAGDQLGFEFDLSPLLD